jgi:2-polyprenyl-3-methyl-5-hydroxy-6-metoxy-1,4-benzoquinol methylase
LKSSLAFHDFPRDYPGSEANWYRFYRVLKTAEAAAPGGIQSSHAWLDIGCHSGAFLRAILELFDLSRPLGCDVYAAADKDERRYECYQKTDNRGWDYRQIDAAAGLNLNRRFEVISALEVIEHIIDTDKFLDDIAAHLAPNGLLLLSTPNINNLINRVTVPFGRYPIGLEYRNQIHHVRLYNVAALRRQLEDRGFEVLRIAGVQLLPQRWVLASAVLRRCSETLADLLPEWSVNVIAVARKRSGPAAASAGDPGPGGPPVPQADR